jgi:hypothetical protein
MTDDRVSLLVLVGVSGVCGASLLCFLTGVVTGVIGSLAPALTGVGGGGGGILAEGV